VKIGIDLRVLDGAAGQQSYLRKLGAWLGDRGHEAHLLVTRISPPAEAARGVASGIVHDLAGRPAAELRAHVRGLGLDVLLLNPERSDAYHGIRANVLRPGYGTDQFRQKLRSFRNPVERHLRTVIRVAPPIAGMRRRERGFYTAGEHMPDVIAVSDYMRDEILGTYALDAAHVHVVPNGVDVAHFSPDRCRALRDASRADFGVPDGALCILMVAHNYRLKGVREAIGHVEKLRKVGIEAHLLVAGRGTGGTQRRQARRQASSLAVADAVHLPGAVHPVLNAYAAADVFLHPSWHDAFGFVVLEAMACGLPSITTPFTGASMIVEEGVSGRVVDPSDAGAVVRCLSDLANPEERARMGAAARAVAESHDETTNFRAVERVCEVAADRGLGPVR
jgi:glycosyltransferase involved in cell wall biosynthesis